MDLKLETYRIRKRRKERIETIKSKLISMIPFYKTENSEDITIDIKDTKPILELQKSEDENASELGSDFISEDDEVIFPKPVKSEPNPVVPTNKYLRYIYWIILFLFWATCYAIAIELKFGIVYLMFSALFGIYFNTRTGPKQKGEISAYSVFNKDFESIDGTLKAEQFEKEMRYGSASVR